jgi:hypothetical protein
MNAPLCRACGKPIRKRTIVLYVKPAQSKFDRPASWNRYIYGTPADRTELQSLVNLISNNLTVVSVKRYTDHITGEKQISGGSAWDGESYADPYFCNGTCSQRFAYAIARMGEEPGGPVYGLKPYWDALKKRQSKESEK